MNWSFFDGIYCINLINETERLARIKNIFNELDIPIVFYHPSRNVNDPVKGCFDSHIAVINKALESGCKNILIFEDDVIPYDVTQERINTVTDFMKGSKWDIFYFGAIPDIHNWSGKVSDGIYSLKTYGTHAYSLPLHTMLNLKNIQYTGEPIDMLYKRTLIESYAVYPSMFYPGSMKSSINNNLNMYEKFPNVMKGITRIKENYSYNIGIPVYIILLTILGIAAIVIIVLAMKK